MEMRLLCTYRIFLHFDIFFHDSVASLLVLTVCPSAVCVNMNTLCHKQRQCLAGFVVYSRIRPWFCIALILPSSGELWENTWFKCISAVTGCVFIGITVLMNTYECCMLLGYKIKSIVILKQTHTCLDNPATHVVVPMGTNCMLASTYYCEHEMISLTF